jgi:LacI family transcriptional regulator, gluconate utilization system Gnt-I transcriptional repressor
MLRRSPPTKSATLHDVAREAGVSLITASRGLSHPERLSPATLQRVQEAVTRTGYVPNLLAGGLKSSKSRTVAALVPVISVPQFLPTVQALTAELDRAGYQLILGQTGYDRARESALLTTMLGRRVDGIVVAGLLAPGAALEPLRRLQVPVVETWDLTPRPVDMVVGFSHPKAGAAVAAFFDAKGYKRVGMATADDQRAMQRCHGFTQAIQASGRKVPTAIVPAPSNVRLGREALARLLEQEPNLQAVHCSSDALAEGVMIEARARGIEVPRRLAVCGFGDADFAEHLLPALTTVRIDGAGIGSRAAQMIVARCSGEAVAQRIVDVAFSIVERASTGR